MIEFRLDDAHPAQRALIERRLTALAGRYPTAKLRLVTLYTPKNDADRSMANTTDDGEMRFNAYWFSRDPKFMNEASHADTVVPVATRALRWHGRMVEEPAHVITHEFGHALADGLPGSHEWAYAGWRAATADPSTAVSGYSLANEDEFFAEQFAAVELGCALSGQLAAFRELMRRSGESIDTSGANMRSSP